jgi:predicted aminopeptidase
MRYDLRAQAARGQFQILNAREPITRVIEDPATPAELRQRLETVSAARQFASRELGLPNNKSYTSYADLERDFVVWSVVATPEFSVEPREWCFPFVAAWPIVGTSKRRRPGNLRPGCGRRARDRRRWRARLFHARQVQ